VVHNGVDFDRIDDTVHHAHARHVRRELAIPETSPVIGTAFRFVDVKQPDTWLRAAAEIRHRVPDAHFVMYGSGLLHAETARMARDLGLGDCVHLPGQVSDLIARMTAFDIFMLSSRSEGFPNVLIESQAVGAIPVTFDVGGCREAMVPGATGFVVKDMSAEALAGRVADLLENPAQLAAMKTAAAAMVRERFSAEHVLEELRDAILGPRIAMELQDVIGSAA
jgi:glycosyltransferase involved in cell wall biosynthesis